jgi:hypothetical protein
VQEWNKFLFNKVGMFMESLMQLGKAGRIISIKIQKDHKMGKIHIKIHYLRRDQAL